MPQEKASVRRPEPSPGPAADLPIARAVAAARGWLLARQSPEGWWCGELESDATLESYFILLRAFLGRLDDPIVPALARTLRAKMTPAGSGGGWSAWPGGPPDLSVSTLAYFALKIAGADTDDPDMRRARETIRQLGGPAKASTYTKHYLAFFGAYDWRHVPAIPPELILLPPSSPVSVHAMSAWSRTIFVPLSIIWAKKPVRALPTGGIDELFPGGRGGEAEALGGGGEPWLGWRSLFLAADRAVKLAERLPFGAARRAALGRAERWMVERLRKSAGLGAILPAMVNSVIALDCLGYPGHHPLVRRALSELERLEIHDAAAGTVRVQPCLSPVWDSAISACALGAAGLPPDHPALRRAASWLLSRQCRAAGDWAGKNPAPPGGWCFEFENEPYPDCDDTCMALLALERARAAEDPAAQEAAAARGVRWLLGMQNGDGGWASFDRGNDKAWMTKVPFADHNAMIDPSTPDVTGRVVDALASHRDLDGVRPAIRRAAAFLKKEQCADGSWFGRWGVNYIYGTWLALRGLRRAGEDMGQWCVRQAADWLERHQGADGGWGESIASYDHPALKGTGRSTPSQTAWAILGLLAAGRGQSAVRRGVRFLVDRQTPDGTWEQEEWTGTGFPRVFYLNYHLYRHYFPLLALAQAGPLAAGSPGGGTAR